SRPHRWHSLRRYGAAGADLRRYGRPRPGACPGAALAPLAFFPRERGKAASMLTFANPWLALLLPLPWLIWRFVPPYARSRRGVRVPFFAGLVALTGLRPRPGIVVSRRGLWRSIVLALAWLLVLGALMRPQWIEPPLHKDKPARDLLLLVDLSGSMD